MLDTAGNRLRRTALRRSNGPDGMCVSVCAWRAMTTLSRLLGIATAKRARERRGSSTPTTRALPQLSLVQPAPTSPAMAPPLPPKAPKPEPPFHPHDTFKNTASATMQTTFAGLIAAATINTLTKKNVGPWGVISRNGGVVALFGTQLALLDKHTS